MPDISQILSTVEQSNLVSDDVIDELRQRLEKSRQTPDLKAAVKWLVQKEHITSDQGRRLLSRAGSSSAAAAPKPAPADDDDLKLFEEPPAAPPPSKAPPRQRNDDLALSPLDDAEAAQTGSASPSSKKRSDARWAGTPDAPPPPRSEPKVRPKAAKPKSAPRRQAEALSQDAAYEADIFGATGAAGDGFGPDEPKPERGKKKVPGVHRSIWDTPFMLLGFGGLALIVAAIAFL